MPRQRPTIATRDLPVHPDDRLLTRQETAAKLGLKDHAKTLTAYVNAYPALAGARRYRGLPGRRHEECFLASGVARFVANLPEADPSEHPRPANLRRASCVPGASADGGALVPAEASTEARSA